MASTGGFKSLRAASAAAKSTTPVVTAPPAVVATPAVVNTPPPVAAPAAAAPIVNTPPPAAAPAPVVTETMRGVAVVTRESSNLPSFENAFSHMGSAALAILNAPDTGAGPLFPTLMVSGGKSGGLLAPLKGTPEEVARMLPQGRQPVDGVFLGYRSEVSGWKEGYKEGSDSHEPPAWSAAVPANDTAGTLALKAAAEKYQFSRNKDAFDIAVGGPGHLRPQLALFFYLASVNDVIVILTPSHYMSWRKTMDNLGRLVDPKTGALNPFPVTVKTATTEKNINGWAVKEHVLEFSPQINEQGKQWFDGFNAWKAQAGQDAELANRVREWMGGADRPLTDTIRANLASAASI